MHVQYAEAKCFQLFLKEGRVIAPSELENIERDECVSSSVCAFVKTSANSTTVPYCICKNVMAPCAGTLVACWTSQANSTGTAEPSSSRFFCMPCYLASSCACALLHLLLGYSHQLHSCACCSHLPMWKARTAKTVMKLVGTRRGGFLGVLLCRYAVAKATRRDTEAVVKCRDVVEGLMGEFLQVSSWSSCAVKHLADQNWPSLALIMVQRSCQALQVCWHAWHMACVHVKRQNLKACFCAV